MFNFFWNWLDPKILKMEKWVNRKVVDPDKLDIDLDKVKKGQVKKNDMFSKTIPGTDGSEKYGPFLTNLTGAHLLGYVHGPDVSEAFALYKINNELWWRHRAGGTTEDFTVDAFNNFEEFFQYTHDDHDKFWECVLRTQAIMADGKTLTPELSVSEINGYVEIWKETNATTTTIAE